MKLLTKPVINSIVVKIASRCNLNCDYCYVYQHADQSYKKQPLRFGEFHTEALATQIRTYLAETGLDGMSICLHGGEPLLAGIKNIKYFFSTIQESLKEYPHIRFAIQTNGVLLTEEVLEVFDRYQVAVSLSLDGPPSANDKHRLDHRGRSSYDRVIKAISLLKSKYEHLFAGIISVIDPSNSPEEIIDFFAEINPPSYDLLFPDANYNSPPPGREENPDLYINWIKRALIHWFTFHRNLRIRTFLNTCEAIEGIPPESELFGRGTVSYLIVETDGNYHFSDMLKVAYEGASNTGLNVATTSIAQVLDSPPIQKYQSILLQEKIPSICLRCPEYAICGSGQVAHRYGPEGFDYPTIYCLEMLTMIQQARFLVIQQRAKEVFRNRAVQPKEVVDFFLSVHASNLLALITEQTNINIAPSLWDLSIHQNLQIDSNMFEQVEIERCEETIGEGKKSVIEGLQILKKAFPSTLVELLLYFSDIVFVRPLDKELFARLFVSFQSETSRGRYIYLSVCQQGSLIHPVFCAQLILYELLDRKFKAFESYFSSIKSRSLSTSLIEEVSVFYRNCYLYRFWQHVMAEELLEESFIYNALGKIQADATCQVSKIEQRKEELSIMGAILVDALIEQFFPQKRASTKNVYGSVS